MNLLKVAISAAALALATLPALAQTPSTLRIGVQEDPDMLDPHKARTFVGRIVFMGLCDRLHDITPELKLVPRLATEWGFSADGLTLKGRLRANPELKMPRRTFVFAGKAAPAYRLAKVIIKFINNLGATLDEDPVVKGKLKVVFLPDY